MGQIEIRTRLTIDLVGMRSGGISKLIKDKSNATLIDKVDIVSVAIDDFFTNQSRLESIIKCEQVDIINLDGTNVHNTGITQTTFFKQLIRGSTKENKTYYEVSLRGMKQNMHHCIFTVNFIGSIIGYKNFIFSSSASRILQCKQPKDLLNIVNLFDSKFSTAKVQNCMSKNVEDILETSRVNRIAFKQSIESTDSVKKSLCPNKKILEEIESSSNALSEKKKDIKQNTHEQINGNTEDQKSKVQKISPSTIGKKKWKSKKVQ